MPTHHQGSADEVRALDAFIKLVRGTNSTLAELLPPLQRDFGLTESQLGVLEALHHLGPLAQGQICQKILKSGSNVTTVVDNLERDGLVRRVRDADDRRVQVVHLTEKGRELIERAFPAHAARVTALMATLSSEEQAELGRLCLKLGRAVAG
ncbi:MAG: putative MarR family transcriptional protein [Gemmatimonadetes bacterium]|jgi:MarR family 2-MHQ and catechol resistance regulon transcriptional repressor|nr:putative MarR family transcriptional protein [Gemmatimonadota bacterium]